MNNFSPSDAALEGFRLTRERPRAILAWAGAYLVFTYVVAVIAELTLGSQSQALLAEFRNAETDPNLFWPAARKLAPFILLGLPMSLAFQSVFTCAIYRAILRPADARLGYLRLGLAELRMIALNLILSLIWGATVFVVLVVAILTAATAGTGSGPVAVLAGDVVTLGVLGAAINVLVRLSLAGPMTFAEGRLMVFESWSLTKGRFWRLLGAYLIAFALSAVVLLLMFVLLGVGFSIVAQATGLSPAALGGATSNPVVIAVSVVSQAATVLILTCFWVVMKSPPAQAYKALTDHGTAAFS